MKKFILLSCLLALTFTFGCGAPRTQAPSVTEPIAITLPQYYPTTIEVRDAIFKGVHEADWRPKDRAPGLIYATRSWLGNTVTLEVDYTSRAYFIKYTDSTNKKYSKDSGNIPKEFKGWAEKLHEHIEKEIVLIGTQDPHTSIVAFPRIAPSLPGEPVALVADPKEVLKKDDKEEKGEIETDFESTDKATVSIGKKDSASGAGSTLKFVPAPISSEQASEQPSEQPSGQSSQPTVVTAPTAKEAMMAAPASSAKNESMAKTESMAKDSSASSLAPLPAAPAATKVKPQTPATDNTQEPTQEALDNSKVAAPAIATPMPAQAAPTSAVKTPSAPAAVTYVTRPNTASQAVPQAVPQAVSPVKAEKLNSVVKEHASEVPQEVQKNEQAAPVEGAASTQQSSLTPLPAASTTQSVAPAAAPAVDPAAAPVPVQKPSVTYTTPADGTASKPAQ